ncbi:MAG: hypothetical protein KF861_15170 [Planctomycetaceae bacterium]|nr:hypothetical protein [Planctomycetaceae bacterium]
MSTKPIPTDPDEDDLQSLAEDLLGVNLSSSRLDVEPFEVEEFDLEDFDEPDDEAPLEAAAPEESAREEIAAPVRSRVELPDDDDDDFGSSIFEDEDVPDFSPAPVSKEAPALPLAAIDFEIDDVDEVDEVELELDVAEIGDPDEEEPLEDTYWDALGGFDWNEESDTAVREKSPPPAPAPEPRAPQVRRPSTTPTESIGKTDQLLDDTDFGEGLEEADASTAAPNVREEDSPRRSRRRRGGRGRRRDSKPQEVSADSSEVLDADFEEAPQGDDELTVSGDDFGAGLDIEPGTSASTPGRSRSGRRRRRRSRDGKPGETTAAASQEKAPVAGDDVSHDLESSEPEALESDDGAVQPQKYRDVPTWEEAIGYLVRHSTKRSGSEGGSAESQRRGGRGKSGSRRGGGSGGDGGRRGGRRGGGSGGGGGGNGGS